MTKTDRFSNIADSVSSWFRYFRAPVEPNVNEGLLEYIHQAIQEISPQGSHVLN